ncbi:flagellar motor protein MotB [[Clostridium] symbiosum]|nr:flagellar motor protein MotB [[Clostridium] symbiosum]MCB6609811.1 OmpA family protein [[Clostridium] symbiosum]MCB6931233.1 OmpA family protein [[Clostridium] symbiosum]
MKRKERGEENTQEWLNTYADMITLVLTFFVLLYSISNVNITKLEQIANAMQKKLGLETNVELNDVPPDLKYPSVGEDSVPNGIPTDQPLTEMQSMASSVQQYMEDQNIQVSVTSRANYMYLRFKNDLLFGPDSSVLLDNSKSALDYIGTMLREDNGEISAVYINGHTAESAGSLVNDRLLSSERAANVAVYLEEKAGVDPRKMITRGYGKYYPIADNTTKEGREQNRRVDMIILGQDFQMSDVAEEDAELFNPVSPFDVPGAKNSEQEGEKTSD